MRTRHRCRQPGPAGLLSLSLLLGAILLPPAAAAGAAGQTLPPVAEPFPAPDFELPGEDGKTYRLSDYRGQVVVLNFWATWCPPCRREMPAMERAWQAVRDEGIVLMGVNVGEDVDTVFEFTAHYPVSFPLPLDREGRVVEDYPVTGLPTTYIVDPAGMVTHRAVGSREWDDPALLERLRALRVPAGDDR
jgi:peroxiredoxin